MIPQARDNCFVPLIHPTLGRIAGIRRSESVVQYLGIQYATLKDRFSRGELVTHSTDYALELDATKHGPIVPNPVNGCAIEQSLFQKTLPFPEFQQSDTECLTLNISVPEKVSHGVPLPVMVFVHGGGFTNGSSSYPQYDLWLITETSVEKNMPMISIGINYRVGIHGFLYSPEMEAAGYKPNNGLDDQRLAFRWIKRNISGFGGDPDKVTFIGESAGASSGCYQLHSEEPLFHQYISMSGTSILRPRRLELVEKSFKLLASDLGAGSAPSELQMQKLLESGNLGSMAKSARKYSLGPVVGGDIIPSLTTYHSLMNQAETLKIFPGIHHCKRILVGDCQFDGMIWNSRLGGRMDVFPKTLARCLKNVLDPIDIDLASAIVSGYELDISAMGNTPTTTLSVLKFGNDIAFAQAASTLAQTWAGSGVAEAKAFLYHFNCPNPWDGPWKGEATHALDIVFALQNYRGHLSLGQRRSAVRFAEDIITFVNGKDPWQSYELGRPVSMIYFAKAEGQEDESKLVANGSLEHGGRRSVLQEFAKKGLLDKVMDAWQMFMQGPW